MMNNRMDSGQPDHMPEERTFSAVALNQMGHRLWCPRERDDEPGKPATRTKINPVAFLRPVINQLKGISDVARPDLLQGRRPDKIFDPLPTMKFGDENINPVDSFT